MANLSFIYGLLATAYLLSHSWLPDGYIAIVKSAPILFLIIRTFSLFTQSTKYLLLAALICSAIGDILLALNFADSFIIGLIAFALAHLFYSCRLLTWFAWSPKRFTITLVYGLYCLLVLYIILPNAGSLYIPVLIYMGIISLMTLCAIFAGKHTLLILFGALLFTFSDSLLAINKFVQQIPFETLLIMLSYYAAQLLIFLGIYRQSQSNAK